MLHYHIFEIHEPCPSDFGKLKIVGKNQKDSTTCVALIGCNLLKQLLQRLVRQCS